MASVDWVNRVITVELSDMTLVSGTEYTLNLDEFRLTLKDLEDDPNEGMIYPDTHAHTSDTVLSGVTYAPFVEFINQYTITIDPTATKVTLLAANTNLVDVLNINGVSVIANNSAGLQTVSTSSSGASAAEVWSYDINGLTAAARVQDIQVLVDLICNNADISVDGSGIKTVTIYEDDGTTIRAQVTISADGLTRTRVV